MIMISENFLRFTDLGRPEDTHYTKGSSSTEKSPWSSPRKTKELIVSWLVAELPAQHHAMFVAVPYGQLNASTSFCWGNASKAL
jgi:hypothetical protein